MANFEFENEVLERLKNIESLLAASNNDVMDTTQAASFLGLGYSVTRELFLTGKIPTHSVGSGKRKHLRAFKKDLQAYREEVQGLK